MLDGTARPPRPGTAWVDSMNTNATASDPDAERNDATEGYERFIPGSGQEGRPDRSIVGDARRAMPFRPRSFFTRRPRLVRHLGRLRRRQGVGGCSSDYYGDLKAAALKFRRPTSDAADSARRAGVYPGQARDIRHQYRLDSPDW